MEILTVLGMILLLALIVSEFRRRRAVGKIVKTLDEIQRSHLDLDWNKQAQKLRTVLQNLHNVRMADLQEHAILRTTLPSLIHEGEDVRADVRRILSRIVRVQQHGRQPKHLELKKQEHNVLPVKEDEKSGVFLSEDVQKPVDEVVLEKNSILEREERWGADSNKAIQHDSSFQSSFDIQLSSKKLSPELTSAFA